MVENQQYVIEEEMTDESIFTLIDDRFIDKLNWMLFLKLSKTGKIYALLLEIHSIFGI